MATMSYCAIENTRGDLGTAYQVLERLVNEERSINEYEKRNLPGLVALCRDFVALYEEAVDNGVISEDGTLLNGGEDEDEE